MLLLLGSALWAQTPSALESDAKGWTDILPNASFKGWTRLPFLVTTPMSPASQWKVDRANKLLICEGDKGHEWLRYDKELTNFIFHAEWRFVPIAGGKGYNSGVLARNSADGTIWHQAQVGDASGGFLMGETLVKGVKQRISLRDQMKNRPDRVIRAAVWGMLPHNKLGRQLIKKLKIYAGNEHPHEAQNPQVYA
jgi:hypothetical protein